MTLDEECKGCLENSQMKKVSATQTDKDKLAQFKKEVRILCDNASMESCAPLLMRDIDGIHRKIFGSGIDYSAQKEMFNTAVLKREDDLYLKITSSGDMLAEAIKYAASANYIDFAKLADLSESSLSYVESCAARAEIDFNTLSDIKKDLSQAKTLLYIHDNCGEIVFDKLLIRVIKQLYPDISVTSLVRGGEIINDVTRRDADAVGLNAYAEVTDSGSAIPGTYLKEVNEHTLELLKTSDVIISKGLGNLETLYGFGYGIYYIFMCKCLHIAERFNLTQWQTAFVHDKKD
ncbi:MAG: ARMT1-like domain-containing protein [Clostridia bacterium]|nr:ARMT1-like domain-containing protein [Clostridia bacterium]